MVIAVMRMMALVQNKAMEVLAVSIHLTLGLVTSQKVVVARVDSSSDKSYANYAVSHSCRVSFHRGRACFQSSHHMQQMHDVLVSQFFWSQLYLRWITLRRRRKTTRMTAWCSFLVSLQFKTKRLHSTKISLEVSKAHSVTLRSRCEPLTSTKSSLQSRRDEYSQKVKRITSPCLVQNWSNSNSLLRSSGQSVKISWRKIKCPQFKIEITITQRPSFLSDGMRCKLLIS